MKNLITSIIFTALILTSGMVFAGEKKDCRDSFKEDGFGINLFFCD